MAEHILGMAKVQARLRAVENVSRSTNLMRKLADSVIAQQKSLAPVKTGNLRRSIHVGSVGPLTAQTIASANYAAYIEYGTGLYGPYHHRIVPVHAKALRWAVGAGGAGGPELRLSGSRRTRKGQSLGAWAFARSVRGREKTPYMLPGAEKAIAGSPLRDSVGAAVVSAWNDAA